MSNEAGELEDYWDWAHTIRDWPRGAALPIVQHVLEEVADRDRILYIGVGDGRNFLRLADSGLDICGCDASGVAVDRFLSDHPSLRDRLHHRKLAEMARDRSRFDVVIASRVLVRPDMDGSRADLSAIRSVLRPEGRLFAEWTAAGTDPWPGWGSATLDARGNLRLDYPSERVQKIYLSFLGCVELVESAGFTVDHGPVPVDLPRHRYPGGIVRDWVLSARANPEP